MPRLEKPWRRDLIEKRANAIVIQDRDELRHEQAALFRLHAHGELVAKVANRAFTHARNAKMLAER